MATVLRKMVDFISRYPTKRVAFTGGTLERTRLYRIIIPKLIEKVGISCVEGILFNGEI